MPNRPRRFVVLEHDWHGVHYDLMLEQDGVLKTWRLSEPLGEQVQDAAELPDHRVTYLDYEGPVSGGRGTVKRVARGTFERIAQAEGREFLTLRSDTLQGTLHLVKREGTWTARVVATSRQAK